MPKIGDVLAFMANDFATRPLAAVTRSHYRRATYTLAADQPNRKVVRTVGDEVLIKAVAKSGGGRKLAAQLKGIGATVTGRYGVLLSAAVPMSDLAAVNGLSALNYADASYAPAVHVGTTEDYGVQSMNADAGQKQYAVDGTGVTVGVLSDSYDGATDAATTAAQDVASGDLPSAGVNVLEDDTSGYGEDEGRAMLQIVHDVAPGAAEAFYTADVSEADFAAGIVKLAQPTSAGGGGAKVIVDDIAYYDEPFFQDGIVAQAVDNVYANYGVSYFSAAGNEARQSYQSTFNGFSTTVSAAGGAGTFEDFDPSGATNAYQQITIPAGGEFYISYQWDSPYASASANAGGTAKSQNSVSLYLLNAAKSSALTRATTSRVNGDAYQILDYQNPSSKNPTTVYLVAKVRSGTTPGLIKYIDEVGGNTIQYDTSSGTVVGHADAAGALAVGAAQFDETPAFNVSPAVPEAYSSSGGTPILFNPNGTPVAATYRTAPGVVGPDGVATTFFYDQDTSFDGQYHFYGTSAASPHVAAVAALLLQAKPSLTNAQVYSTLESTASDMSTAGFDYDTGYGLVQADKALASVAASSISGSEFVDTNNDGVQDNGETGAGGKTVFLDADGNGVADSGSGTLTNDTPTDIPDANATYASPSRVTSSISSSLPGRVTNVTVTINASHARFSDLGFTLITPSGVRIPLLTNLGNLSAATGTGINLTLSDAASSYVSGNYSNAVLTGTYKPQTPLAAAINESAAGTWQLEARDYESGATGTINSWSLNVTYADPTTTTDANGNFSFAGLTPSDFYGTYHLRTAVPGYTVSVPASPYDLNLARSSTVTGEKFALVQNAPPSTVAAVVIDDGTAQRSVVRSITVTLNGAVPAGGIASGAFTLVQTSGPAIYPWTGNAASVTTPAAGQTKVVLTFSGPGLTYGSLADGRYTLTVDGSKITDANNQQLDGAGNGVAGSSRGVDFFKLFADVNGSGKVEFSDFLAFQNAFGSSVGDGPFVAAFDYDNNLTINSDDFLALQNNFGATV